MPVTNCLIIYLKLLKSVQHFNFMQSMNGNTTHGTIEGMFRGGSRVVATSKMECFRIIVNGVQPLTIAAALDPPLIMYISTSLHFDPFDFHKSSYRANMYLPSLQVIEILFQYVHI